MAKKKVIKKKLKMKFGGTARKSLEEMFMQFMGNGQTDPTANFNQVAYDRQVNSPGFIESPDATLTDNQIRTARAQFKSESNPYTQGLDMASGLVMSVGSDMMKAPGAATTGRGGEAASTEGFGGFINKLFGGKQMKAFGGKVNGMPVEVEGEEVGELPNGQMLDFEGPSHEQGGIDTMLPAGTDMFSKRIKIDGKSMAERKKIREKKLAKFEKKRKGNPTDALVKNAHERQSEVFDAENLFDMQLQEQVAAEDQETENYTQPQEFKYGGPVIPTGLEEGYGMSGLLELQKQINAQNAIPGEDPTVSNLEYYQEQVADGVFGDQGNTTPEVRNTVGDPTFGDALGMYGNMKQAYDPYKNTLENRAGDTPNINPYLDYGKTALAKIQDAKQGVKASQIQNDKDLNLARNTIMTRGRHGARGINTKRALDIAADTNINSATSRANVGYAGQMSNLEATEAELLLGIDGKIMAGEGEADINNRKDRDMFYQNIGKDKAEIGKGLTSVAKSANQIKARGVNSEMLNSLADYLNIDVTSGKAVAKGGQDLITARKNRRELEAAKKNKTRSDLERLAGTTPEKIRSDLFNPGQNSFPAVSGSKLYSNVKMADVESELASKGLTVNLDDKEDVRRLQKLVGAKVDGDFGKNTMEAIKKYKKR